MGRSTVLAMGLFFVLSGCGSSASTTLESASAPARSTTFAAPAPSSVLSPLPQSPASATPSTYVPTPSPELLAVQPARWPTTDEAIAAFSRSEYSPENLGSDLWLVPNPKTGWKLEFNGVAGMYVTSVTLMTDATNPASEDLFSVAASVFAPGAADWMRRWLALPSSERTAVKVLVPVSGSTAVEGRHSPSTALLQCFMSDELTICGLKPT